MDLPIMGSPNLRAMNIDFPIPSAVNRETTLRIEGMTCASCSSRVEKALLKVPGVATASVNLATERATVQARPDVAASVLQAAVKKAGYEASALPDPAQRAPVETPTPWWPVAVSVALTLPTAPIRRKLALSAG